MKTRAKFKCTEIAKREGWGDNKVLFGASFVAVGGNSEENKKFFAASPSGSIKIDTVREDHFQVGQEYFVDFTPA
jgi:hypothetical protein